LLYDKNIISALLKDGIPFADAVDYCCGGCMEIGIQGKTSDFLFNGWQNITKILELTTTGGYSLVDDNKLESINPKGLMNCRDFEDYYNEFINLAQYTIGSFLKAQDIYSEGKAKHEPAYLISTMIDDCIEKGRNMHDGGARYHDYGSATIGIPNSVDYLMAVKKAVFDEKIVSAEELIKAMSANFVGYEDLQRKLKQLPRFGCENAEADAMAIRLVGDISNIFTSYRNRLGGKGKIIILTFTWAPAAGWMLGATAYGDVAGKPVAHGITPQGASMTKGITAAINSCTAIPFDYFNGGASTMWDLDEEFAKEPVIKGLFMTFFKRGGQIYQGNTTDLESLYMAQEHPEDYYNLIVRVGGYSARFVTLGKALQDEIINRIRHKG
jgi:formate C-acetyltransferase